MMARVRRRFSPWIKGGYVRLRYASRQRKRPSGETQGINLLGFFSAEGGLASAARGLFSAAQAAGVPVMPIDLRRTPGKGITCEQAEALYAVTIVVANPDTLFEILRGGAMSYMRGQRTIGAWTWEAAQAPANWRLFASLFDEIVAPSAFAAHAIERVIKRPVRVLHHAIGSQNASEYPRASLGIPESTFVFLTAADGRSGLERKNPLGAIGAFRTAFGDRSDVLLLIKAMHLDHRDVLVKELRRQTTGTVRLIEGISSQEEQSAVLHTADAFISLHRGEGFGLSIAEAMGAGIPVIATGYGGNMEYMSEENAWVVRHRVSSWTGTGSVYPRGTVWAEPDLSHAASLMKHIHAYQEEAQAKAYRAQQSINSLFSAASVGRQLQTLLHA